MNSNPQTYKGEWWVPSTGNESPTKFYGSVIYTENEKPTLELMLAKDLIGQIITLFDRKPVICGLGYAGNQYTLFNTLFCSIKNSSIVLSAEYFLIGAHIPSLDYSCFVKSTIKFPNLKYWVLYKRLFKRESDERMCLTIEYQPPTNTLVTEVEDGLEWGLRSQLNISTTEYEWHIYQDTDWGIKVSSTFSISQLQQYVMEISQFLSVAMLGKQTPSFVFLWLDDSTETNIKLLFKQETSDIVIRHSSLIPYEILYDRVPSMLQQWHKEHDSISPICSYLISSLEYKSNFSPPDFLIVAQALDGYYKRYLAEKEKNIEKTKKKCQRITCENKIETILDHFKEIEVVKLCGVQPKVFADTRNKYSHLAVENKDAVVDIQELRSLTVRYQILLICCVLERMGLSIDEINICCTNANIKKYWL